MSWFIKKGDPVEESKPAEIEFNQKFLVSDGQPKSITLEVFCDENSKDAPTHKTSNGRDLVTLEADLTHISKSDLNGTIKVCEDGKKYYVISGAVEATFYSASTKYVLLCRGKRYDTVTAEYV
jgi:hypothetical protein